MSKTVEVNFSELIQKPKDTVAKLSEPRNRRLLLHRRDDEDLVLTTAARAAQDSALASATTRMFVALMSHDEGVRTLVTDVMPEVFPWVRFLPTEDVRAFVVELVETLRAIEDLDNPAPVVQVITEWRHTAEVHADPELLAILRQPAQDLGPVPSPTE